ncbi:MAG: hypothetical protein ACRECP_01910 [Methylocella sp.]
MRTVEQLGELYTAVWNETDPQKRREMIADLWTAEGRHYVGAREVQGYEALEQRIIGSHEKNVRDGGYQFKVTTVRALQDAVTVDWDMVRPAGSEAVAAGRDVLIVDADRRILTDYQFIVG